jgi:hypothetical protein
MMNIFKLWGEGGEFLDGDCPTARILNLAYLETNILSPSSELKVKTTLEMEAVCFTETLVSNCKSTRS